MAKNAAKPTAKQKTKPSRLRRVFKWTFRGLLTLILLVGVLIGGALIYLDTDSGRGFVLKQVKSVLEDEGLELSIGKSEGSLLSQLTLRKVELRDSEGVFFAADKVDLTWTPTRLISRRLLVDSLVLGGVTVKRAPKLPESSTPPTESTDEPLSLPVSVELKRLEIDSLSIDASLIGAPMSLRIEAKAAAGRDLRQVKLDLSYRRIDRNKGQGDLRAVLDAKTETLDLDLKIAEGKGGLAATLMGQPDLPGLDVELKGAGSLRGWSGRFMVASEGADLTDGTLRFAAVPNLAIRLNARVNPSSLVPRLSVLKDPLQIELDAELDKGDVAKIGTFVLRTTGLSATASGQYGLTGGDVSAKVAVDAQDLSPLAALLGGTWRGRLAANLDVTGKATAPRVAGKIEGRGVQTPWGGAQSVDTNLTMDAGGAIGIRRLVGTLSAKSISAPQGGLAEVTGRFDLRAPATGDYPEGTASLTVKDARALGYRAEDLELSLTARPQAGRPIPSVDLAISAAKLSAPDGNVEQLAVRGTWSPSTLTFNTAATAGIDLSGLKSRWAEAETVSVSLRATPRDAGTYPTISLQVTGRGLSGQGAKVASLSTTYDGTLADDGQIPLGKIVVELGRVTSPWANGRELTVNAISTARPNQKTPNIQASISGVDLSGNGVDLSSLRTEFKGSLSDDWKTATGTVDLSASGLATQMASAADIRLFAVLSGATADGIPLADIRLALGGFVSPEGSADFLTLRAIRDDAGALFADVWAVDAMSPQASIGDLQARIAGVLNRETMRPSLMSGHARAWGTSTANLDMEVMTATLSSATLPGSNANAFAFKLAFDAEGAVGHAPDAPNQEIGIIRFTADGNTDLTAMSVDLASLSVRAGFANVSGRMRGRFQDRPRVTGTLKLSGTPPSALLNGMQIVDPEVDVKVDADLSVPDVQLDGAGSVARVVTGRPQIDGLLNGKTSFAVTGRYRPGSINLTRFDITTPAASATGGGQLTEAGSGTLKFSAKLPDLALFKALLGRDIAGQANLDADLRGSLKQLAGRIRIVGDGLKLDGQTVGKIDLSLDGTDLTGRPSGRLQVKGSGGPAPIDVSASVENGADGGWRIDSLSAKVFGATATGSASLGADFMPRTGQIKLSVPNLAPIGKLAGMDLRGRLTADGQVASNNGELSGTLKATARGVVLPGLRVGRLAIDGRVSDAATLKGLRLQASASSVVTSGATITRLQATARPNGKSTAVTLSAIGRQDGKPVRVNASATIVEGGATTVATINRFAARYARLPITLTRPMRIALSDSAIKIDETAIALGRGRISLGGNLAGQNVDAKVTIAQLPLGIARQAGVRIPVRGRLAGTVAVTGTTAAPAIAYDLRLRNLRPTGAGTANRWIAVDAKGKLQGQRLEIDARIANLGDGPVTVSARVPAGAGGRAPAATAVQGRIAGTIDLDRMSRLGLLGGHSAQGKLRMNMRLAGTYGAPVLTGNATLTGGRFENVDTGTVLDAINLRLTSAGNALALQGTMTDGASGRVAVNGRVLLSAAQSFPLDVKVVATRAHLMRRDGMDTTITSDLGVVGDLQAGLNVKGTITVNQADVQIPSRLPPNVVLIDVVEKNVPANLRRKKKPARASPPLPIAFDVTVNVPRRFFVRGRGIESEWQGTLKIEGRLPDPRVQGALRVVRGQLDFLGQRFSIVDSQIRFDGANIADPVLEIDATTTTGDVKGIVQIRGTAQNPTFRLTSDPELPRDEVLSRVLFGSDVGSLSTGQAVRLAAAAAQLAAPGSGGGVMDRLRRFAGLDVLDVGSSGDDASDTTVTAGKYVTDRVLLKVEQGASTKNSRVGVEIEVFKDVIVESDVDGEGGSRVGIKFRYDY